MAEIDFKWDLSFLEACGIKHDDMIGCAMIETVVPIRCLYDQYVPISTILEHKSRLQLNDLRDYTHYISVNADTLEKIKSEMLIYEAIYAIMLDDMKQFERVIVKNRIDVNYPVYETITFSTKYPFKQCRNFTFLTIAATLGRLNIVRYLIDGGADVSLQIGVFLSNKHYELSVNECILVNALYRWYKSGKKEIMNEERLNAIIDTIFLASQKYPSIVNDDHIHPDHGIFRMYVYWGLLRDMAQRSDFIERLLPLNPQAIREIYDYKT